MCEPGTDAAPKPRSRAALLVSRCLLAEPLPLETSLPAPHLEAHTLRLLPFSAPLAHWQPPWAPPPHWAFPGGVGVGGKCRGSVTAESGRSESGGESPPNWGQGPQTTPWAEPTAEGSEGWGFWAIKASCSQSFLESLTGHALADHTSPHPSPAGQLQATQATGVGSRKDLPGGLVVKNPRAYAGDTGPGPGLGRLSPGSAAGEILQCEAPARQLDEARPQTQDSRK